MSLDLAAQYLSSGQDTFRRIAVEHRVDVVDLGDGVQRWRKTDLDRVTKRLPAQPAYTALSEPTRRYSLSDVDIDKLAHAVARQMASQEQRPAAEFVSIKDACSTLGPGRTTIYALIKAGRLQTRQIGRRTLVPRSAIAALLEEAGH